MFVTARDGGPIIAPPAVAGQDVVRSFFAELGHKFGVQDSASEFIATPPKTDLLGFTHITYHQVFQGVPVFSGIIKLHQNARGELVAANGRFRSIDQTLGVTPSLTMASASAIASKSFITNNPVVESLQLVIVDPGWYGNPPIGERLAYYMILSDVVRSARDAFFIDAQSGVIVDQWSLVETDRDRAVYDGQHGSDLPGVLARVEGDPPVLGPPDVNTAYDYLGDAYDYYFRAFGRDGIDDAGLRIVATINTTAVGCPNAAWFGGRRQALFCEGAASDDVVAHEVTHGVTQFTAGLVYRNQSGQLNESFSDVFGELVDLFNGNVPFVEASAGPPWPPSDTGPGVDLPNLPRTNACAAGPKYSEGVRWLIAESAPAFRVPLRDMWNPPCHGDPDRANSPLQTCNPMDNGGVHSGSGVPNHAFAMVTDGKTFNGYTVQGIGPIKSGAVWYRALTTYLPVAPNFVDAYYAFNQAAADLVGSFPNDPRTGFPSANVFTADDAAQIDLALRAVEMDTPGRCGLMLAILNPEPPPACARARVIYKDDFENGGVDWTVENTQPPTPYDWVLTTSPLPFGRSGVAWFCADPKVGDCDEQDESAVHSLISAVLPMPSDLRKPRLRFTHYITTEGGFDGGNVKVRVNDGPWQALPGSAFIYNPYNTVLFRPEQHSTNPLAGEEGWSGVGGKFGTSVIALDDYAHANDAVQVAFEFGKDGCGGVAGWFIDNVEIYDCPDCDRNGRGDDNDMTFTTVLGVQGPIGKDFPVTFQLAGLPPASEPITLHVSASGDLSFANIDEFLAVKFNDISLGHVFDGTGSDCPEIPDVADILIDPNIFNTAIAKGGASLTFTANDEVAPFLCDGSSYVRVVVSYRTMVPDRNENGISDYCEKCRVSNAPSSAPGATLSNRHLTFETSNPGRLTAVFVTRDPISGTTEPPQSFWAGPTVTLSELHPGESTATYAPLNCAPVFADWSSAGTIHLFGKVIAPNRTYTIRELDVACVPSNSVQSVFSVRALSHLSPSFDASTVPNWGDITGKTVSTPDGTVDLLDLAALLDRFTQRLNMLGIYQADLAPATPDQVIDVRDLSAMLDAFHGRAFIESDASCGNIPIDPRVDRN